jgi:predicted lipoprotein with Yx(FWY)xxD motif
MVKTAQNSKLGTILVSSTGLTLYQLNSEKKDTIKCTGSCGKTWPPLLLDAGANRVAGTGASQAKLRTIKRPDHGTQITYNRNTLYSFRPHSKPSVVKRQNVADFHIIVVKARLSEQHDAGRHDDPQAPATATPNRTQASGLGYGAAHLFISAGRATAGVAGLLFMPGRGSGAEEAAEQRRDHC